MKKVFKLNKIVHHWQKKLIFGISFMLMIGFIIFTMNSCNKEDAERMIPESQSSMKKDATAKVKAFKEMLKAQKGGNLELRSTYTAEELIYNIEANMNYTYAEAGLKYDDYATKTDTISVPELGGPMTPSVVTRVNDEVLDSIECFFENVAFNDKKLKLVDIFPVSGQNAIGVTTVVGSINMNWVGGNFGPGDDWKANVGKCDGTNQQSSAPDQIAKYATWNVGTNSIEVGTWYSDYEWVEYRKDPAWFALNPNDPILGDWIVDYFEWQLDGCSEPYIPGSVESDPCSVEELPNQIWDPMYGWVPNPAYIDAYCIDYPEMNYYLANAEEEALKFEPILNKKFLHMRMYYNATLYEQELFAQWWGSGYYAKKNVDLSRVAKDLDFCK